MEGTLCMFEGGLLEGWFLDDRALHAWFFNN